jgi:hypothetical protein
VRSPGSPNVVQPVERAARAGVVVGLIALMVEGTVAILSLAAVAFITSAYVTSRVVIWVGVLLFPRFERSL